MTEISGELIKELRSRTQAGIKDCKKALTENNSDMPLAIEWLRKRGITKAGDKADRVTAEGIVHSYIHFGSRIGVLVELNCETDFVAKREEFKELADNIAKQIAACSGVEYVSTDRIPQAIVEKEKAIESGKDDLSSKPEAVREKIVQGRIDKRLKEISLLDQPFIKDQSITVDELIKQTVSVLKENIRVRRFVRYSVGEEIAGETTTVETPDAPAILSDVVTDAMPEVILSSQPEIIAEVVHEPLEAPEVIAEVVTGATQEVPEAVAEVVVETAEAAEAKGKTTSKKKKK